jgi:hypothetical protein
MADTLTTVTNLINSPPASWGLSASSSLPIAFGANPARLNSLAI